MTLDGAAIRKPSSNTAVNVRRKLMNWVKWMRYILFTHKEHVI